LQIPIGAEAVGVGADDLEELEEDDDDYIRLGHEDEHEADFSKLQLKPDHQNRHAVSLCAEAAALISNLQLAWTPSMSNLIHFAVPVLRFTSFVQQYYCSSLSCCYPATTMHVSLLNVIYAT